MNVRDVTGPQMTSSINRGIHSARVITWQYLVDGSVTRKTISRPSQSFGGSFL